MLNWIVEKWDWWIYARAHHSLRRICKRNGGFAYLLELYLKKWREENPISPELECATEIFFESLERVELKKKVAMVD